MRPVEIHPEAQRELEDGTLWYESQRPGLGAEFLEEVSRAAAAVMERPSTWPRYPGNTHRYLLHRFPYALVYAVRVDFVVVLAVMHLRRKPGYWRHRF